MCVCASVCAEHRTERLALLHLHVLHATHSILTFGRRRRRSGHARNAQPTESRVYKNSFACSRRDYREMRFGAACYNRRERHTNKHTTRTRNAFVHNENSHTLRQWAAPLWLSAGHGGECEPAGVRHTHITACECV